MLRLDPRTKLALLFTVTTLMLGASNEGAMLAVKMLFSLVPFVLILSAGRWQMASKYLLFYALCFLAERIAFSSLHGLSAFAVLALYSGQRGRRGWKYFFYAFYPAHFLVLLWIGKWIAAQSL